MKIQLAALALGIALVGCDRKDRNPDTGAVNDRSGMDTVVKSGTIRDTTVIKADTNIDVDTVKQTDHIKKDDH